MKTEDVKLSGTYIPGRGKDLPTMIWLPELVEPAENFKPFFTNPNNKISSVRNVWLLNYRNQGGSDHHHSYDMDDISEDIIRFMDQNKITMATIGGHGFGAKVAAATAINNLERFTGVIQLEGGPLDHRYHEAYQELASYIQYCSKLNLKNMDAAGVVKALETGIPCAKWQSIFKSQLDLSGEYPKWKFNVEDLAANTKLNQPDVAVWRQSYGLWPGQALAIFASESRWVHMSTNTLPFYNVFPRLQNMFPDQIFAHADGFQGPMTHWLHEEPSDEVWYLSQRMWRWLRWHDGCHVLHADKSEAGWKYIPDRASKHMDLVHGEYSPEYVHHDYLHTDAYERSREARGATGAQHGEFLPGDQFSVRQ